MGIAVLPLPAVRAIRSSQSLTDPASAVKELIDNSLDAGATIILVEITSNTIDKIKVRDNGHGIPPEDRSMACKRNCTSKIRSLEDLSELGGKSLGFRGEALASAAEMTSKILLTTRIEGEPTAMEIEFGRNGLLKSQKRVSHAIGTTVQLDNFLSNLPVRRQTAEKSSTKGLAKTKKLLQAYALARPYVRLSLRVLKAKDDKADWNYAPRAEGVGDTVPKSLLIDAAIKLFGARAFEQCRFYSSMWSSAGTLIESSVPNASSAKALEANAYTLTALVVDPKGAYLPAISGLGQHISIDNRPVSCSRGMLKEIVSHYKSSLRSAASSEEEREILDPLLVLNIVCPNSSYDVNVEPAKDDVLFTNPGLVLSIAQKVFYNVYGEPQAHPQKRLRTTPDREGFEILLAKKTPIKDTRRDGVYDEARRSGQKVSIGQGGQLGSIRKDTDIDVSPINEPTTKAFDSSQRALSAEEPESPPDNQDEADFLANKRANWKPSMYADDEQDLQTLDEQAISSELDVDCIDDDTRLRDVNISNPWTFAKMKAPFRPRGRQEDRTTEAESNGQLPTPRRHREDVSGEHELSSEDPQISPSTSPIPFPYPMKPFGKHQAEESNRIPEPFSKQSNGRGALDSWLQKSSSASSLDPNELTSFDEIRAPSRGLLANFVTSQTLAQGTALRDIPNTSRMPRPGLSSRRGRKNVTTKPFISPVNDLNRVWFDIGSPNTTHRSPKNPSKPIPRNNNNILPSSPSLSHDDEIRDFPSSPSPIHPDLAITLDYEARKAKATQAHRESLRKERAAELARLHAEFARQPTLDSFSLIRPPGERNGSSARTSKSNPNSPHTNRYSKAIAALHTNDDTAVADDVNEAPAQPKRAHSKRRTSTIPPLERVKEKDYVSDLILTLSTNASDILCRMQEAVDWDEYVFQGASVGGFEKKDMEVVGEWEDRLRVLMKSLYRREYGGEIDRGDERGLEMDLSRVLLAGGNGEVC